MLICFRKTLIVSIKLKMRTPQSLAYCAKRVTLHLPERTSMSKERQNTIKSAFKESFSFDIGAFLFVLISTVLFILSTCVYIGITVFNLNGPNIYSWIEGVYLILIAGCAVFILPSSTYLPRLSTVL